MSHLDTFLTELDEFLKRTGMAESTFGRKAVNDGKFVGRLRRGGGVQVQTLEKARAMMASFESQAA